MSTSITPNLNSISLYLKQGSSDKEYHVDILGDEQAGFTVQFRYGKRGNTLQVGVKNKMPINYEGARAIFNELIQSKQAKGYTDGISGTPYQNTEDAGKVSGVLPQLLNDISEDDALKLIEDDAWIMEEKKDGVRRFLRRKTKKSDVEGINRKGLVVPLPEALADVIKNIGIEMLVDGELIKETYWLFDLLSIGVHAIGPKPYSARLKEIDDWLGNEFNNTNFRMVPTAVGTASKKALWKKLRADKAEGVVFIKADSVYAAGRPASRGDRRKHKFYATASVRVKSLTSDVRSVEMEVLKQGDWVGVGRVTVLPNFEVPAVGAIIEVRYLNYNPDGSIYQPVYLGERDDINEDACLHSQLKVKPPVDGEGEEN